MKYILIPNDVINSVGVKIQNGIDEIDSKQPEKAKAILLEAYTELITNITAVNVQPESQL